MDHLIGLKENVIIGKLIPAGAGLGAYRELAERVVPDAEEAEAPAAELTGELEDIDQPDVGEEHEDSSEDMGFEE